MKKLVLASIVLMMMPIYGQAQSLEEAFKNIDGEKFVAANKVLAQLATSNPSAENLFYQGYGILKSPEGNTAEGLAAAESLFSKGAAADKKDAYCEIGLGMVKLAKKDQAGAKAIFDAVKSKTKSKNPDVLYRIAEAYTMFPNANDPAEAISNIDLALDKSKVKDNPDYYLVKSDAYLLKNDGGDAMNALQNAERLNKKPGKIYAKMARVWLQGRNYTEAKDAIAKGIAADPTFAPLYKYQSSYLQTMGKYQESAEAAKNYLKNSDSDCKGKLRYAKLAFIAKDYSSVRNTFNDIQNCAKDPYILRMDGIMDFEEKKPTEAIAKLKNFIANAPADVDNPGIDYGYIGRAYLSMPGEGEVRKMNDSLAILNIEKAVELKDSTFNYYGDLAATFLKNKNYPLAAKFAEKEMNKKKDANAADYATVGSYFAAARNWNKSDELIDKALSLYQDKWPDGYALSARIKTYKNSADSTYSAKYSAAPLYEKYLSLIGDAGKADPKNRRNVTEALRYLAGREYLVNKDIPKASAYLTEIMQYDPENKEAQAQLNAINGVKADSTGTESTKVDTATATKAASPKPKK